MTVAQDEQDLATFETEYNEDPKLANKVKDQVCPYQLHMRLLKRDERTCNPAGTLRQ